MNVLGSTVMNSYHRLNILKLLLFALIMLTLLKVALHELDMQTPGKTTESVHELREIDRECRKVPHGYSNTETIWNAPVGQPRKPVRWIITCQILK